MARLFSWIDGCLLVLKTVEKGALTTMIKTVTMKRLSLVAALFLSILSAPQAFSQAISEGFDNVAGLTSSGWALINNSSPAGSTGWFQGNTATFSAQSGAANSYIAADKNNVGGLSGTISNWLLTPARTFVNGDVITFYTRTSVSVNPDRMEVRMSTAGTSTNTGGAATSVGDFTTLLLEINAGQAALGYPTAWTPYTLTLSGLSAPTQGRIALRYFVTGAGPLGAGNYIGIDNFQYTPFPCPAITINPASLPGGTPGVAYATQTLSQSGGANPTTYAVSSGTLPTGLTLSPAGTISGTPSTSGSFTFTVTGTNTVTGCTGTRSYTISIACPAITINPASLPAGLIGTAYTAQTLSQTGGVDPTTYAVSSGTLPPGLTLSSSGTISGMPTTAGSFTFIVTGTNTSTGCSGTRSYTISVTCPAITITPASLPAGATGTGYPAQTLIQNVTGPGTYTITAGALPPGLSLSSSGTISGTPTTAGSYNFTVMVSNSTGCTGTRNYTVIVTINCPPVTINPATLLSGIAGVAYPVQTLSQSGGTNPTTYAVTSGNLPPGLTLSSGGQISGTPAATGSYTFTITGTNTSTSCTGTRTYTVTVGCPSISINPPSLPGGLAGSPYATQTLSQSGGADPSSYAITSGSLPPGLTLSSAGVISGTPGLPGSFTFTVTATNSISGCTGTGVYTIGITCPAVSVNPAILPSGTISTAYPTQMLSATGSGGTFNFAVTSGTLPPGLSLGTSGILSGTPSVIGSYTFTVTATGSASGCAGTRTYTVAVTCAAPGVMLSAFAPVCSNAGLQTLSGGSPAGGTFFGTNVSNGSFNPGSGTQTITYTYTNGSGCTGSAQQTFPVVAAPAALIDSIAPVCEGTLAFAVSVSPAGGVLTGVGLDGPVFSPSAGTQSIKYVLANGNGCADSATRTIVVLPAPMPTFSDLPDTMCPSTNPIQLTGGTPAGGVYSGAFVDASAKFTPIQSGRFAIAYSVIGANGCPGHAVQYITVYDCPLGLGTVHNSAAILRLYPVPATALLNAAIMAQTPGGVKLTLVDVSGRIVWSQVHTLNAGDNRVTIDVSSYARGLYMMIVQSPAEGSVRQKVALQ